MTSSSTSPRTKRGSVLPKGTVKVSQECKANLEALEELRKQVNDLNRLANSLRKQVLAEVGEKNATLVHRNAVVGHVVVETSMAVSKERLLEFRPDVFEELALPSQRVTVKSK